MPGPVPKRSDRRIRRNKDGGEVERVRVIAEPVEAPPLGFTTHEIAMSWYESLATSGQARYYEPSDWQSARMVAHEMGRMLNRREASGQLLSAVWSAMGDLLTTEAARRRTRMELERAQEADDGDDADVIEIYGSLGLT
jgi:hypothetical protein